MGHIQGQDRNQLILFPECIEDYISSDNMVRVIDEFIEQTDLKKLGFTRTESNEFGRSSYSSKPLSKLYLYGYMNSVRSSRKLEREARRNVELMWLLGKLTPDHQTIARFRKENAKALKRLFRSFVKMCNELGMYGKEMIATDGSKFEAVNATDRNFNDKKLNERIAKIEEKIEAYMQMLQEEDKREEQNDTTLIKDTTAILTQLIERKAKYENYRDYLTETENTQISETDPDSRRMQSNGRSDMCYNIQHSIDAKHKLVVEFEVTNQANDINQLSNMTERSAEILDAQGICSVADKGYDNATEIAKCIMQGHNPQVIGTDFDLCITTDSPEPQITNHHEGRCVYLEDRNIVLCPMGKILYPSSYKNKKAMQYFAIVMPAPTAPVNAQHQNARYLKYVCENLYCKGQMSKKVHRYYYRATASPSVAV